MNDVIPVAAAGETGSTAGPGGGGDSALEHCASSILAALHFAAEKHRDQRRKGQGASPYINHPIEVAELLVRVGRVSEVALIQAAVLHDTVEDTETTFQELEERFGAAVRRLVEEVTDDKTLPKEERKRLQIEHAPRLSAGARQIKLADKICNVRDLVTKPPLDWPLERRLAYLDWAERVVAGCLGANVSLEHAFQETLAEARAAIR